MKIVLQPWGGLQIAAATQGIQWAGKYSTFNFAVRSDAPTSQIQLYVNGGTKVNVASNTGWTPYHYNLASDLNAPATVGNPNAFVFFNNGPNPVNLYVDSVTLA